MIFSWQKHNNNKNLITFHPPKQLFWIEISSSETHINNVQVILNGHLSHVRQEVAIVHGGLGCCFFLFVWNLCGFLWLYHAWLKSKHVRCLNFNKLNGNEFYLSDKKETSGWSTAQFFGLIFLGTQTGIPAPKIPWISHWLSVIECKSIVMKWEYVMNLKHGLILMLKVLFTSQQTSFLFK